MKQIEDTFYANKESPRTIRRRYLIFMGIVCGSSFILTITNTSEDILLIKDLPVILSQNILQNKHEYISTIETLGCKRPLLKALDDSIKKFVYYPKRIETCNSRKILLNYTGATISIKKDKLKYYHVSRVSQLRCCYQAFSRPAAIDDITSPSVDHRVKYEPCITFTDQIKIKDEFVRITCSTNTSDIYTQYFLTARKKRFLKHDDKPEIKKKKRAYNILILGIDSVSRLNLYRTMPKTIKFMNNYGGIDLTGYNKVGDNTFPNLIPLLIGTKYTELKHICHPYRQATFDNCPFIWEWFKQAGYYTALVEDTSFLGTFNYNRGGFSSTPTDYYIHTFIHEAEKFASRSKSREFCMGEKLFYQVLLDYATDLTTILKHSKLFGFFWEVTMTHGNLNYPMVMDDNYVHFFEKLQKTGYLYKTIVFFLSDHGIRWGRIRSTKQGRIEERLPFSFIMVPPSFRARYPMAYNHLQLNSKSLTTPYDIHATLVDLIDLDNLKDEEISNKCNTPYATNRSISLFLPIPKNRTCVMADIDDHWCTCRKETALPKNSTESIEAASHLILHLNFLLRDYPKCVRLTLTEVLQVIKVQVGPSMVEKGVIWREYMVMVRTSPGDAVFEATLRDNGRAWVLSGTVSRLNLYGNQSECVDDKDLELYCYCS